MEKRKIPFIRIQAGNHQYNPAEREVPFSLLINRTSSSVHVRGNPQSIFHATNYLAHVERLGIPVFNGTVAHQIESSKAKQSELFADLNIPFPKTRIVNNLIQVESAAQALRFPIVIKTNLAGNACSVSRFSSIKSLKKSIDLQQISLGFDHTALIQEYIPPKDGNIFRIETLNGKFLYALKISTQNQSTHSQLAESFQSSASKIQWSEEELNHEAKVEAFSPSQKIVDEALRIVRAARLDAGAVEYVISASNEQLYFCNIIALSNFVGDPINVIGFDPFVNLVDYIEDWLTVWIEN